jgi:hypothetical protein
MSHEQIGLEHVTRTTMTRTTMTRTIFFWSLLLAIGLSAVPASAQEAEHWRFDDQQVGALPDGWKAEGTNQRGPVASWKAEAWDGAPSAANVQTLREAGATAVYVSHDPRETAALSDRVAVLEGGRIVQVGTLDDLRRDPATGFVTGLIAELRGGERRRGALPRGGH